MKYPSKIYMIPTPLAPDTAKDILPPQVTELLPTLDHYLAEEIRTARRFLSAVGVGKPIEGIQFRTLDRKTKRHQLEQYFRDFAGKPVGVLSEAGCPGVADPGAMAVDFAHEKGIPVIPLVGPSSLLMALMGSGMNGQSFIFHGYIPIDKTKRIKTIKHLERESEQRNQTQIFIETPFRNKWMLVDLIANCRPETKICVACDLTAPTEYMKTRTVKEWKRLEERNQLPDLHKRPTVFLVMAD